MNMDSRCGYYGRVSRYGFQEGSPVRVVGGGEPTTVLGEGAVSVCFGGEAASWELWGELYCMRRHTVSCI